ncbi:MAG: hypothetical protein R6V12_02890, partial [Candidatus Hydrogenedentota bacterium]
MNEPREDAVDKPNGGLTPARYIHLALAVFLAAGAVDSLIALVFDIEGQGSFLSLFGQIVVAGALAVGAYVVASAVLALFAGLMGRRPTDISLFVALAVGLLVFMSAVLI